MNPEPKSKQLFSILSASIVFAAIILLLAEPERAMDGAWQGLSLCCQIIIPSLFPFLVLSRLLLESPFAQPLGILFSPYIKCIGVTHIKAASALLCGLLGGFAAGASAVSQLYDAGELSDQEAERLLICCIGSSPAFVVGSVGAAMLGSVPAGWFLFLSQTGASLLCGLCFKRIAADSNPHTPQNNSYKKGISHAVEKAVSAISVLCGYVILFSFLSALIAPSYLPPLPKFILTLPLEVTNACRAGADAPQFRLLLCSIALSTMGLSVFFQVNALTKSQFSLRPLLISRIPHTIFALLLLKALLTIFPIALPASFSPPSLVARRMPYDVICILFLLCALAVSHKRQIMRLPSYEKRV